MTTTATAELDVLLGQAEPVPVEQPLPSKGKTALNRENQQLQVALSRAQWAIRGLMGLSVTLAVVCAAAIFYATTGKARALQEAFRTIHYRESRALGANAVVLDEWQQKIQALLDQVKALQGLSDEERAMRMQTLDSAAKQAEALKKQFLAQMNENESERGAGASFQYRDPYMKKTIKLDEELGGAIDLDKLRDEIRDSAKIDEAMKAMEASMLDPTPLKEQVRLEAETRNVPVAAPKNASPALPGGLQLPGAR